MDLLSNKIEGKPVTRFPVYLEKKGEPHNVQVAANLNDVTRLLKDGSKWINRGPAPYDKNRAVLNSKPSSKIVAKKSFEVFRVVGRTNNTLHLFPEADFSPSVTWASVNRPRVGGYLLRHDVDYYTFVSDKLFDRQYANSLDTETRAKLKNCMSPPKPKQEKPAPVTKVKEVVEVVDDTNIETMEGEDLASAHEFLDTLMIDVNASEEVGAQDE